MCGICGFTGPQRPELLRQMCVALRHRGPDDSGYYESPLVSLGMRRLAIVDLIGGHQPMYNERKTIAVVCNGEIYNFPELRQLLAERGHRFNAGHSDSEVCPHAFEEWGKSWVKHLNGMFAVALWNAENETLYLYRDRVGKKPLYYARVGAQLIFASEIKALLLHPDVSHEPDFAALGAYFACKAVPSGQSAYACIRQVPPGSLLRWRAGEIHISRYWQPDFTPNHSITEPEAATEILHLLDDAVGLRMRCDVPFGAYLSGGVDSSAVIALMAHRHGRPVQTFSLGYSDGTGTQMEGKNADIAHARHMSNVLGTVHHELFISASEFADAMPKVITAFDEPFSGTVSTFFLSSLIARHVTVALSGDGADELFASYLTHRLSFPIQKYLANQYAYDSGQVDLTALMPFHSPKQFQFLQSVANKNYAVWYDTLSVFNAHERRALLRSDIFCEQALTNPYANVDETFSAQDALNRALEIDQNHLLPEQILPFVDRLSMAHSVEVRCPFLDYRLIDFVNSLPGTMKIASGVNKYILKKALNDVLPQEVLERPKEGFVQPIYTWMHKELRGWFSELLHDLPEHLFHRAELVRIVEQWQQGNNQYNAKIWNLACFSLWWSMKETQR